MFLILINTIMIKNCFFQLIFINNIVKTFFGVLVFLFFRKMWVKLELKTGEFRETLLLKGAVVVKVWEPQL